jgi:acyl-CoA thioester hydrolase
MFKKFSLKIRIYWEDTDAGGIVYYANYLKFAERARTEMLRSIGINQADYINEKNILFLVRSAKTDFIRAAKLDDEIHVETHIEKIKGAKLFVSQNIKHAEKTLCNMNFLIVSVNKSFKPVRVSEYIIKKLSK